jgi:hypothetical protein
MKRWRLRVKLKVSRGELDIDVTIEPPPVVRSLDGAWIEIC